MRFDWYKYIKMEPSWLKSRWIDRNFWSSYIYLFIYFVLLRIALDRSLSSKIDDNSFPTVIEMLRLVGGLS